MTKLWMGLFSLLLMALIGCSESTLNSEAQTVLDGYLHLQGQIGAMQVERVDTLGY